MRQFAPRKDLVFSPFTESLANYSLPEKFTFPFEYEPHPLVILAVKKLQQHLTSQQEWNHNFGLSEEEGVIIGKMFGVLLVRTEDNEIGYLAAFSGKLAGGNHHPGFVPPIFDGMENGGFLNAGMVELSRINHEISILEKEKTDTYQKQVQILKTQRKNHSVSLQNKIFDQYNFLNQNGEEKSLRMIFEQASYKNPPAGAGNVLHQNFCSMLFSITWNHLLWLNSGGDYPPNQKIGNMDIFILPARKSVRLYWPICWLELKWIQSRNELNCNVCVL